MIFTAGGRTSARDVRGRAVLLVARKGAVDKIVDMCQDNVARFDPDASMELWRDVGDE